MRQTYKRAFSPATRRLKCVRKSQRVRKRARSCARFRMTDSFILLMTGEFFCACADLLMELPSLGYADFSAFTQNQLSQYTSSSTQSYTQLLYSFFFSSRCINVIFTHNYHRNRLNACNKFYMLSRVNLFF